MKVPSPIKCLISFVLALSIGLLAPIGLNAGTLEALSFDSKHCELADSGFVYLENDENGNDFDDPVVDTLGAGAVTDYQFWVFPEHVQSNTLPYSICLIRAPPARI